jgi:hypothetical protein
MLMSEKPDSSGLDYDSLQQAAAGFRASDRFAAVLRDYTSALVRFRQDPRFVNKLVSHQTRFRLVNHLLCRHAEKVLAGGPGGVTYSEMLDLCATNPDIGLRVLKSMLPMLVVTGHAAVARDANDRRVKIYTPTERLLAVARLRLEPIVAALQVLQPDIPRAAALRNDPGFLMRAVYLGGHSDHAISFLISCLPEFTAFSGSREGAAPVVYAVMLADMDAAPLKSRTALAKQFGLSKTQVWSVFAEGERLGYFAGQGDAVPVATDRLRRDYANWTALELAFSTIVLPLS